MSQDNADDLLPSGYGATPPELGSTDIGVPIFHEALWLALCSLDDIVSGAHIGPAYRLMWGQITGDEPRLDGEVWIDPVQMEGLVTQYLEHRAQEPPREGG